MDVGRALSYVLRDPRWVVRVVAAAALLLVPFFGWVLLFGYGMRIVRQVAAGVDLPLPGWNDWGGLFGDGLRAFGVSVVWSLLPSAVFVIPRVAAGSDAAVPQAIGFALNLVAFVVTPAALGRVAVRRSFVAGIEGGPIFRMLARNAGDFVVVALLLLVLGVAAVVVVAVLGAAAFIGAAVSESRAVAVIGFVVAAVAGLLLVPYLQFVGYHLYGQAYYRAEPRLARSPDVLN